MHRSSSQWLQRSLSVGVLVLLLGVATQANAASFTFVTGVNPGVGDGPVNARADFTTSAGQVVVFLGSLQQNPTAAGQLVSGVIFTVSGGTGSASIALSAGPTSNIAAGGAYSPSPTNPLAHWGVGGSAGSYTLETAGPFAAGGSPFNMIIGPDSLGGVTGAGLYSAANPSITGHSPSVIGAAGFTLNITGVTAASTITAVSFLFGTGPDGSVPGTPPPTVPEPSSLALVVLGAIGLGVDQWRRRRQN